MAIKSEHLTGILIGAGAAAAGFYLYKKNQAKIDDWLRRQGINIPHASSGETSSLSLEDLVKEKERLEDLIAERQVAAKKDQAAAAN